MTEKTPQQVRDAARYQAKRDAILASAKERRGTPGSRAASLAGLARSRARKRGLPFTITNAWVAERLTAGRCEVTGITLDLTAGAGARPFAPSLDQRDPGAGYTPDNTQVVCWLYNAAKGVFGSQDVLRMAAALVASEKHQENP